MRLPPAPKDLPDGQLPCGFSMAVPFIERLKHHRSCAHVYCRWRNRVAYRMGRTLARAVGAQRREAVK